MKKKKERKRKEVVTIWPVHRHSRFYPTLYRTRADHLGVFLFLLLLLLPYSHLHFDLRIKPLRIEKAVALLQEEEMMKDSSLDLFQSRPSAHSLNTCVPFFILCQRLEKEKATSFKEVEVGRSFPILDVPCECPAASSTCLKSQWSVVTIYSKKKKKTKRLCFSVHLLFLSQLFDPPPPGRVRK